MSSWLGGGSEAEGDVTNAPAHHPESQALLIVVTLRPAKKLAVLLLPAPILRNWRKQGCPSFVLEVKIASGEHAQKVGCVGREGSEQTRLTERGQDCRQQIRLSSQRGDAVDQHD